MTDYEEMRSILAAGAKEHFWLFCNYMDFDFFQKRKFLKKSAMAIQALFDGEISRLSISMPPRAGKSYLTSLAAAYWIGRRPECSVMRNSCTATLYQKLSYDVRGIVKSDKFKAIFETRLSEDKSAVTGWNVNEAKQVSYFGGGVGGTIIGFGCNGLAITDDLYKGHSEAMSDTIQEKTRIWHQSEHESRLEGAVAELDIGTRWTKKDVIGMRMERGDYDKSIIIPALNEDGESFCPHVRTTEQYLYKRKITDPFIWNSEYMQRPVELEGLIFPEEKLKRFFEKNETKGFRMAFIDTADEGEDSYAMPIVDWFHEEKKGYLIDVIFNKDIITSNEALTIAKCKEHEVDFLGVETNKEGSLYVNNLRKELSIPIYGQFNTSKKMTRILMQSGFITEFFRFKKEYETGSSYDKFMRELTEIVRTKKDSKHDDAPDSLAGLAGLLRRKINL